MEDKLTVSLTTDPQIISACALMMSASDPWITLGMNDNQCIKDFDGDCKEIYVAEYRGEIAGFVIIQICGTFKGYIQTICISKDLRRKGFGKRLLQFCEQRILKISPNIFICVSSFNKGAIKLYLDFGFKLVGEPEHFVKEGFTELLLRKSVGPIVGYQGSKNDHNTEIN
jgi:ribosomal protein S18 acetylase RimI-like enzyme